MNPFPTAPCYASGESSRNTTGRGCSPVFSTVNASYLTSCEDRSTTTPTYEPATQFPNLQARESEAATQVNSGKLSPTRRPHVD